MRQVSGRRRRCARPSRRGAGRAAKEVLGGRAHLPLAGRRPAEDAQGGLHDQAPAEVMRRLLDWIEGQFQAMGRSDARELAVALFAAYQGIALLTNTLRDPELMVAEGRRLERWIDSLG